MDANHAFEMVLNLAEEQKGWKLVNSGNQWAHFECTTPWMRFVDDFAMKLNFDEEEQWVIDIKSSSRVGYSDLEANRKRIEKFKEMIRKEPDLINEKVSDENKSN